MPRKRRFYQPGVPVHAFQRGHNREPVFFDDQDYLAYLRFLKASADALGCLIHAYVLMTNHVHLLVTPTAANDISLLFQDVGRYFVPYINKTYQRRGSLWEGRHKGHILDSEDYFLMCMRYIEMNPLWVVTSVLTSEAGLSSKERLTAPVNAAEGTCGFSSRSWSFFFQLIFYGSAKFVPFLKR